jgi:hypothetical protein
MRYEKGEVYKWPDFKTNTNKLKIAPVLNKLEN